MPQRVIQYPRLVYYSFVLTAFPQKNKKKGNNSFSIDYGNYFLKQTLSLQNPMWECPSTRPSGTSHSSCPE